jgi:phosphoserine phosphatase
MKYVFHKVLNHEANQAVFSYFFKGLKMIDFDAACRRFALSKISGQIRRKALEQCEGHFYKGHRIIIISASIRN